MARPWTPQQDLPSVKVVMDPRVGVTLSSNGTVQSWASQFGGGVARQDTVANQPTVRSDKLIQFDTTDFLTGLNVGATSRHRTVVAVAGFVDGGTNRTVVGGAGNNTFGFRRSAGRLMQPVIYGVASLADDAVQIPDFSVALIACRITDMGGPVTFNVNGRQTRATVSDATAGRQIPSTPTIQIGNGSGQMANGPFGAIVIADAYVSDSDLQKIEGWCAWATDNAEFASQVLAEGHPYRSARPMVETATPVTATGAATLAPMTGASTARAAVRATESGTLAPMTGSATGRSVVRAVAAAVLGSLTGASTARSPAKGDGSGLLRPLTGEASARAIVKGLGHATLGELTGAAVARAPVKAWASIVLGLLTGAGLGGQERALRASPSRTIRLARELRRIVLKREARLVRLTQGGRMNPERWPDKDPDDVADFAIGWGDFLGADSIVSAEWIATDGLVVERSSIQGAETIVRLSGGRAGRFAMVTCRILTERGDRFDRSVKLAIFER